jgi:hypothetical protein
MSTAATHTDLDPRPVNVSAGTPKRFDMDGDAAIGYYAKNVPVDESLLAPLGLMTWAANAFTSGFVTLSGCIWVVACQTSRSTAPLVG